MGRSFWDEREDQFLTMRTCIIPDMSLFAYWPGYWDKEDWERSCEKDRHEVTEAKTYADYTASVTISLDSGGVCEQTHCAICGAGLVNGTCPFGC